MAATYKAQKEAFVSNHSGSSIWDINQVTLVAPAAVLLWSILQARQRFFDPYTPAAYLADFLLQCGGILFATTVYAAQPVVLNGLLLLPAIAIYLNQPPPEPKRTAKPKSAANGEPEKDIEELDNVPIKPFVTNYRGAMLIVTCICILAVDFNIFPRRFAKTESWGTSLMDLGVGSFVFSAGVVTARQQLKDEDDSSPVKSSFFGRISTAVRNSLPLLALGFIRLYSVKGLDYQEHVTEYGVHWNFFFTLGLLPLFVTIFIQPFVALFKLIFRVPVPLAIIAFVLCWWQQLLFTYSDLLLYIHKAPRDDWLSQNREGVVSFVGYLAIFLAGQGIGIDVLQRDVTPLAPQSEDDQWVASMLGGDEAVRQVASKQRRFSIIYLGAWSLIWSVLLFFTIGYYGPRLTVSRRLANLPYLEWVAAFNCVQLLLFCAIESLLFPDLYLAKDKATERKRGKLATSRVLSAFNRNGLAIFLLANLLTGAINLSLSTLTMGDVASMAVLVGYIGTLAAAALALDHYDISIRL